MCSLLVSVHICPLLCSEFFLAHFGFCLNCQRVITLSPSLKSVLCIDVIFRGCGVYSCYYIPGPPTWLYNFDECCLCCFAVISCSDCPLNACLEVAERCSEWSKVRNADVRRKASAYVKVQCRAIVFVRTSEAAACNF